MERKKLAVHTLSVLLVAAMLVVLVAAPSAFGAGALPSSVLAYSHGVQRLVAVAQALPSWQQVNSNGFGDQQADEVSASEPFNGYLYAGTSNVPARARIFRTPDGVTWTPVTEPGFGIAHDIAPPAILDLAVFSGRLYASTGRGDGPAQIWRTLDGENWAPMVISGFSNPDTVDITVLAAYNGALYAGAQNLISGAQIWRSFTGDSNTWTQVAPGTPGTGPASVSGMAVFDGALYAAVESDAPAQVWFSYGGDWMTAVSDGFGDSQTTLTGGMVEFGGYLYVGAGNVTNGAQLWRSNDGQIWEQAIEPAFGDPNNQKVEMVFVFQNQLYASVRNVQTGIELWRSTNGTTWERANLDGFGDSNNTSVNGNNATANFLNQLYVGTSNVMDGGELWRMQQLSSYGVALSPGQARQGAPGQIVTYTLTITNTGDTGDSFGLTAAGQTWSSVPSPSLVNLAPSASALFSVTVTIPPGAADQDSDSFTVTATSQADSTKSDSAVLTTTSIVPPVPVYGVALSPGQAKQGSPGQTVTYTLTITNSGNAGDSFGLTAAGQTWSSVPSTSLVNLAPSASALFSVTVTIPPGAADQDSDSFTVTATSQADSTKSDSAVLTTTSIVPPVPVYGVALSPGQAKQGAPGQTVTYTLTITNSGNASETVDLVPTGNYWSTTLSSQSMTLAAAGSREVTVSVLIPPTATASESDQVSIRAGCYHDSSKYDIAVLTTVSTGPLAGSYLPLVIVNSSE